MTTTTTATSTAVALFAASALAFAAYKKSELRRSRSRRLRRRRSSYCHDRIGNEVGDDEHDINQNHNDDVEEDDASRDSRSTTIGSRGAYAGSTPAPYYWNGFQECMQDPCDPMMNPEGRIALCVAENKLVQDVLAERFVRVETPHDMFANMFAVVQDEDDNYYKNENRLEEFIGGFCGEGFGEEGDLHPLGLPSVRRAAAHFLARRFLEVPASSEDHVGEGSSSNDVVDSDPETTPENNDFRKHRQHQDQKERKRSYVNPDHVAIGAGCNSLLCRVTYCLTNGGGDDAVLIPAPHYRSFENDVQTLPECVPYSFATTNPAAGPSIDDLDKAKAKAEADGLSVKILLLTNPNDPLGVVYGRETVLACIKWARSNGVHTIVDEVYALTAHKMPGCNDFESVIKMLDNDMGGDVHVVWSPSKMGASGLRLGVLYTQHERLLGALAKLNSFSGVSRPVQRITAQTLFGGGGRGDDGFLDVLIDVSRARLEYSYGMCTHKLEEMVIPYIPADAGLFVYADFSSLLPSKTFEGERQFAMLVQSAARIVMTPGASMREAKPGHFRLCYAWVNPDVLEIAMERLSRLVAKIRRYHWDDLNPRTLADVVKDGSHTILRHKSVGFAQCLDAQF